MGNKSREWTRARVAGDSITLNMRRPVAIYDSSIAYWIVFPVAKATGYMLLPATRAGNETKAITKDLRLARFETFRLGCRNFNAIPN